MDKLEADLAAAGFVILEATAERIKVMHEGMQCVTEINLELQIRPVVDQAKLNCECWVVAQTADKHTRQTQKPIIETAEIPRGNLDAISIEERGLLEGLAGGASL